jgi:hypothetical protein
VAESRYKREMDTVLLVALIISNDGGTRAEPAGWKEDLSEKNVAMDSTGERNRLCGYQCALSGRRPNLLLLLITSLLVLILS